MRDAQRYARVDPVGLAELGGNLGPRVAVVAHLARPLDLKLSLTSGPCRHLACPLSAVEVSLDDPSLFGGEILPIKLAPTQGVSHSRSVVS
ncbi:hypothetical protein GCM10023175_04560 [Pseudonocardia xishanensis]|uniref:Uncharacterized protein n=1 Tax=Pseudonocardia xishanensis TaxID=630995 RepID=A0ABP8REH8_9PSEU